jgi:hypothetical protein
MRSAMAVLLLIVSPAGTVSLAPAQSSSRLQAFFEQNVGLSHDQIEDIRNGISVVKAFLPAPRPKSFCLVQSTSRPPQRAIWSSPWISIAGARFRTTCLSERSEIPRGSLT